jgi:hypothetical protein
MPFVIKRIKLNRAALLSVVDKGASGDEDNRPSIVLFKRKKEAAMPEEKAEPVEKAEGLAAKIGAIDEMGFNDEQKAFVLGLMEQTMKAPADEAAPATEPAEKQEEEPAEEEPKPEDEEMQKRHKAETIELQKRIDKLEAESGKLKDEAETVRLNKRADELKFLPMKQEETVALLKRIGDDKAAHAMLDKLAKASEESPLLQAAGAVVQDSEGTVMATVNKRVKAVQDAKGNISAEKAKSEVFRADPKLYNEYLAEQRN